MVDLLEQSSAWLEDQREKFLSRQVIYQRGEQSVEVTATIGQTVFAVETGDGAAIRIESRDYLIRAAMLNFGSGPIEPRRGDRIQEMTGGVTFVYEVLAPSDEPVWRYSDAYRITVRIHTKQIAKEIEP